MIKKALLRAVRYYTFNTPISFGRHRAYLAAMRLIGDPPRELDAATHDGRRFSLDLSTGLQTTVYFLGEYEKAITDIVEKILVERKCRVFLDVGANFDWYKTLFHKHAGSAGEVHAFEPVPSTFYIVNRNYRLEAPTMYPSTIWRLAMRKKRSRSTFSKALRPAMHRYQIINAKTRYRLRRK